MRGYSQSIGFSSIVLPANLNYVQLPPIPADFITLIGGATGANVINIASSASPGTNFIIYPLNNAAAPPLQLPVDGTCSNLFIGNSTVSVAQTIGFMWLLDSSIGVNG